MLAFFAAVARLGHAADGAALIEQAGPADRWRPLHAALAAVAQGEPRSLRRLAPEIRGPAEQILREIMPDGVAPVEPGGSSRKAGRRGPIAR